MNVVLRVHRDAIPVPIPPTGGEGNGPQHLPPPALEVGQKVGSEREGKGKERKRPPSPTTPRRSEKHHQPATTSRPGRLQDPQPRTPLQNLTRIYTRAAIAALPRPVPLHSTHTRLSSRPCIPRPAQGWASPSAPGRRWKHPPDPSRACGPPPLPPQPTRVPPPVRQPPPDPAPWTMWTTGARRRDGTMTMAVRRGTAATTTAPAPPDRRRGGGSDRPCSGEP